MKDVKFVEPAIFDEDRVLRQKAAVGGFTVECRCSFGVIIQLDVCAAQAGAEIPSYAEIRDDPSTIARWLQPYWKEKIINERYDDDTCVTATLSEEDLQAYLI
jgi:hypothetical protein